jgi:hypothetical protein
MNKSVFLAALLITLVGNVASVHAKPVDVEFLNKSKWTIEEMYLSPTHEEKWGPDQLGEAVIKPGASFKLSGIPENKYDFKLIDEDGDECIVEGLKVAQDSSLKITDQNLLSCQDETEGSAEED